MHDDRELVEARISRFIRERLAPALWRDRRALNIEFWAAPGEPVTFETAVGQEFRPFSVGEPWGAPWGTVWFRISGTVPAEWAQWTGTADGGAGPDRAELLIDLGFTGEQPGFQAEGLVYTPEGTIVKALEPENFHVPLSQSPGESFTYYIEAASNPNVIAGYTYAPTPLGSRSEERRVGKECPV